MLPLLRSEIEAVPTGEEFLLYDRTGISVAQLTVSLPTLTLINALDGEHSLLALQDLYAAMHGEQLPLAELEKILAVLDTADFLSTPRFHDFYAETLRGFRTASVRPATSAGSAYSDDAKKLAATLTKFLHTAPPPEEADRATNAVRRAPRGALVPHLDFARGGKIYAQVYRELAACCPPTAVVLLGTAHYPLKNRFAVCPKDFALPDGVMRYHRAKTAEFLYRSRGVADFTEDLLAHRNEHSIELQLVWLRHIWGAELPIIPLLAAPVNDLIENPARAAADAQLKIFAEILHDWGREKNLTIIASADLAHVGERFGDTRALDAAWLRETEHADRAYLSAVKSGNAAAGLQCLHAHADKFRLCGTGSIYALNAALPNVRGRLLGYQQAISPELSQAVSCAGLIFE